MGETRSGRGGVAILRTKFKFFEVVRIESAPEGFEHLCGQAGPILGRTECEDGSWTYSVSLEDIGETFLLSEGALSSTGKFVKREDIYDGSSVRVSVDPETGEGKLIE